MDQTYWRKCGSCKKDIGWSSKYQVCSVSSCGKFAFCSVDCWNQHNPVMNHKSAWAEERISPRKESALPDEQPQVRRIIVGSKQAGTPAQGPAASAEAEILIVASKLKQYVKDTHDMNTSASVLEVLSTNVRRLVDRAAQSARSDGRKTIMDRDFT
ncbi:MAG TPA: hypothetical protein VNJ01_11205 [Bacteriovoracaceae bacterium]|nr:hypothetical protein [Bacteriovoracaceae bacterium]